MSDDKPLHIQVAEALGWTNVGEVPVPPFVTEPHWLGDPPSWVKSTAISAIDHETGTVTLTRGTQTVPRYDTDWSATGPLIEKYNLGVGRVAVDGQYPRFTPWRAAVCLPGIVFSIEHAQPLVAVCNLILALHTSGKLHHNPPSN